MCDDNRILSHVISNENFSMMPWITSKLAALLFPKLAMTPSNN